jgi:putative heme iron utilization protein
MQGEDRSAILRLLAEQKILALAVLVDGEPYAGAMPFAATRDLGAVLVHVSKLSRHTRGLVAGAPYSVVIHAAEGAGGNPFDLARVTFQGHVAPLERETPGHAAARATFLAKLPEGAMMFGLGDFGLYELRLERGRFFAGFGRTVDLSPASLAELAADR